MKKNLLRVLLIGAVFLSACTSITKDIRVSGAADSRIDFSGYKSYSWLDNQVSLYDPYGIWQPTKINVAMEIKSLIDRELQKRGYKNYPDKTDLAVVFFIGVDMESMKLKADPYSGQSILENSPAAGLTVALIDNRSKYVVWSGKAIGDLQETSSDQIISERLDYAVTEMFKRLPKN